MSRIKKDSTKSSLTIAVVAHVLVFLVIFVWAAKTGKLDPVLRVFNIVPTKKPEPPKEKPKPEEPKVEPKLAEPTEIAEPQPTEAPQQPATQALTTSAPNPNAPPSATPGFFSAPKRDPAAKPAPFNPRVVAGNSTTKATGSGAGPKSTSLFSKEATKPSTVASVMEERRAAVATQDAISSEQISRSTASDAAAVVSKVAGASIVEGKFVVVRGLSDRYNVTTLNGADIPTADPYRKAAQLDLIPTAMIDRITVNKTFTPDQPGGFAGGAVNVVTKSFPEKAFASISFGTEYNTQASLNEDFLGYKGGSRDWFGMDDGTRALPSELENATLPSPVQITPENADALSRFTQSFGSTQFAGEKETAPLNHSFSLTLGDTAIFMERPVGIFASLSYKREFEFYENAVSARYDNALGLDKSWADTRAVESVNWAGAVSLAYQLHPDHELGFNFIYNQNSEDTARRRVGTDFVNAPDLVSDLNTLHFIERQLNTFQFKGRHEFPDVFGLKIDWLAAFSNTSQDEPDLRYFNYYRSEDGSVFRFDNTLPQPIRPTRYFRALEEDNVNLKLDAALPFLSFNDEEGEIKAGVFSSSSERTYNEQTFTYGSQTSDAGFTDPLDPNTYLNSSNLNYTVVVDRRGRTNYIFDRFLNSELGNSSYEGTQDIQAAYLMSTLPFHSRLRLVGGARLESTDLRVSSTSADLNAADSVLRQTDLLPAISLIGDLSKNVSLRLSYAETITRPTYREIAGVRSYDLPTDTLLDGNPNLQITGIKNYDARLEWFPNPGEIFAVSVFYKDLAQPIEKYAITQDASILTYVNRNEAKLYGIEFEARKSLGFIDPLLASFSFGMNLSLIDSEVELTAIELNNKPTNTETTRPLYDQSPYIFNADLNYSNPHLGTSASLTFTLAGPRIFFVNPSGEDVYEHPPTTLDFTLSQRLTRNLRMRFSAKNLLDLPYEVTYGDEAGKNVYTSYKRGMTFGVSLAYDF